MLRNVFQLSMGQEISIRISGEPRLLNFFVQANQICRAQYGTTKYCSAYLRHETCNNRNCTFLHEVGEDHDSFSRQDLSSMNAMSTQRPAHPSSSRSNQASQPQPPAQQNIQSISQALHSIQLSKDDTSRTEPDAPALPSSANWAAKNSHTEAGRSSKPPSMSDSSPVASSSQPEPQTEPPLQPSSQQPAVAPEQPRARPRAPSTPPDLMNILAKKIATADFSWSLDRTMFSEKDLQIIDNFPPLFMMDGGRRRFQALKEQEQERLKQEEERNVIGAVSTAEDDENLGSGSLQLGGEPETQDESADTTRFGPSRSAIQPPANSTNYPFGALPTASVGNLSRTITPQQRDLLQRVNSARQSPVTQGPFQQGYGQTSLHQHQTSNPFQNQAQGPGVFGNQGHARQTSRFTFSNETSHSTIKPAANPQLSAQQAGVLPAAHGKQFQGQFHQSTAPNFYSGVQGPPPGLKSSGTPPISGGGMFGQGHGFASAMGGSAGFGALGKNANDESIQQFLRSRDRGNSGQGPDFGKRELKFPFQQQHVNSDASASNNINALYGSQLGPQGFHDTSLQKQQKKKGKKHRHANTSSSGGGGIVDLSDPSILQARMHPGGVGQNQFGQNTYNGMYGGFTSRW